MLDPGSGSKEKATIVSKSNNCKNALSFKKKGQSRSFGAKCGRKVSEVWALLTDDENPNHSERSKCKHCHRTVAHHKKSDRARLHLENCTVFQSKQFGVESCRAPVKRIGSLRNSISEDLDFSNSTHRSEVKHLAVSDLSVSTFSWDLEEEINNLQALGRDSTIGFENKSHASMRQPTIKSIEQARQRCLDKLRETSLYHSDYFSRFNQGAVYFKLETDHHCGSYRARCAHNFVMSLPDDQAKRGVVMFSDGTYEGSLLSALIHRRSRGTVFQTLENRRKLDLFEYEYMKEYIEIRGEGKDEEDSKCCAMMYASEKNMPFFNPKVDPLSIAACGSVGREIFSQCADVDIILVAARDAELLWGIKSFFAQSDPQADVIECYLDSELNHGQENLYQNDAKFVIVDDDLLNYATVKAHSAPSLRRNFGRSALIALASFLKSPEEFFGKSVVVVASGMF